MSVRTEIDRINGVVNDQTTLLAQIQTALEGKAAGGGSGGGRLETCTVTITPYPDAGAATYFIGATLWENDVITPYCYVTTEIQNDESVTIENVICGSTVTVCGDKGGFGPFYFEITGDATIIGSRENDDRSGIFSVRAPMTGGESCEIVYTYEP